MTSEPACRSGAVLLGANPESFRPKDVACPTAGQRQSYLRTFRFVQPPVVRMIHAPAIYREMLVKIYANLGVAVSVAEPSAVVAKESRTGIKVNDRGYGVINFVVTSPYVAMKIDLPCALLRAVDASGVVPAPPVHHP